MLKKICLICAAVVITWVTLLILMWAGHSIDKTLLAILMGMSVSAIATKYGQNLIWKTGIVVLGLPLTWSLINNKFIYAGVLFAAIVLLTLIFSIKLNSKKGVQQADIFKDCC